MIVRYGVHFKDVARQHIINDRLMVFVSVQSLGLFTGGRHFQTSTKTIPIPVARHGILFNTVARQHINDMVWLLW